MIVKHKISVKIGLTMLMTLILLPLSGCGGRSDIGEPRDNIAAAEEVYTIGVNAYLWRAALDTLSFMPMLSADHEGGAILTDWKVNPANANERTKVDVYIVGKELRADALNITVHREALRDGNWISIEPRPDAATQINTAIVIQARLLRRDNAPLTSR
jgi:uncharacterized protein DUF3576|tara:strand:+ start:28063 stop:28536 length:474 start_codon:yes stop_codon:yes gene_type:complete